MLAKQTAKHIAEAAKDIQAVDCVILDLKDLTSFTDYFVICSGKSDTQVRAIADSILEKLKAKNRMPLGMEGYNQGMWVLIDFGDVVAHIFYHEVRDFYSLEKLWADATQIEEI